MSFFGTITKYINKTLNAVKEATATNTASSDVKTKDKKQNSVVQVTPDKIGDTFSHTTENNTSAMNSSNNNVRALKASIDNACIRNKIDQQKLYSILLNMVDMQNMEDFYKLPEDKQVLYLGLVGATIERAEKYKAKNNQSIDITEMVIVDISLVLDALKRGIIKNKSDLGILDKKDDLNKAGNLLDNINSMSEKDIEKAISDYDKMIQSYIHTRLSEIKKLPKEQQDAARTQLYEEIEFARSRKYNEILMKADSKHAANAITIVNANGLEQAQNNLYKTRKNAAERMVVAHTFNYKRHEDIVRIYHERGDDLSVETYQMFATNNVSHMSADDRQAYSDDYVCARQTYEQTGYPEYMPENMLEATATAIVAGTQVNEFMTVEERSAALTEFYQVEQSNFGDANKIFTEANDVVQEYINTHPEYKTKLEADVEKINNSVKKEIERINPQAKASTESNQSSNEKRTSDSDEVLRNFAERTTYTVSRQIDEENSSTNGNIHNNTRYKNNNLENKTVTKAQMAILLETSNNKSVKEIAESLKISENTVLKVISQKGALVDKYTQEFVVFIKKQKKAEDLIELANSSKAIELIIAHNNVENKEKLNKELDKKTVSTQKYLLEKDEKQYAVC